MDKWISGGARRDWIRRVPGRRLRPLIAAVGVVSAVLLPSGQATASNAGTTESCAVSATMHVSNGVDMDPLDSRQGTFNIAASSVTCGGADYNGAGGFSASGTYADPFYMGSFTLNLSFPVATSCSGTLSAIRLPAEFAGTLDGVTCTFGSGLPGSGTVAFDIEPDPITLNTCGGSATQPLVCDFWLHGNVTYHRP